MYTNTLDFIIENSSQDDYNITVHSWDVNGIMGGGDQYGGGVDVAAGKKARCSIDIENSLLDFADIDNISDINVIFWAYKDYFKEWSTELITIKTNLYNESDKVNVESEPIYSDEVVDVWYLGAEDDNTFVFAVKNKSQYNATCTFENCSVNEWTYELDDYSLEAYNEPINKNAILAVYFPVDAEYLEENGIDRIDTIEFDILLDDDNWDYESNLWTYTTKKINCKL